jgi:hypothetical protein
LKIGGKGQDGGYQGSRNGVGPWEYIKEKPKVLHSCFFSKLGNCTSNIYRELKTDIYYLQITIFSIWLGKNGLGSSILV